MLFIIHHTPVTAKGGCLWQQNNGNAKIRTLWWNISLTVTPVCAESNVNIAARSSTPRPETASIAAFRPAATRCWTYAKASESVLSAERTSASAAGNSSYQFGQMPDIAAMPVGRKATVSVKQMLLLSCKVVLPILEGTTLPQPLIAHSQIPTVGIWAVLWNQVTLSVTWFVTPAESSSHFGNLIVAVSKSGCQNDNLILAVTKPPELSFWELRF